jgi:hypothetical protein
MLVTACILFYLFSKNLPNPVAFLNAPCHSGRLASYTSLYSSKASLCMNARRSSASPFPTSCPRYKEEEPTTLDQQWTWTIQWGLLDGMWLLFRFWLNLSSANKFPQTRTRRRQIMMANSLNRQRNFLWTVPEHRLRNGNTTICFRSWLSHVYKLLPCQQRNIYNL